MKVKSQTVLFYKIQRNIKIKLKEIILYKISGYVIKMGLKLVDLSCFHYTRSKTVSDNCFRSNNSVLNLEMQKKKKKSPTADRFDGFVVEEIQHRWSGKHASHRPFFNFFLLTVTCE